MIQIFLWIIIGLTIISTLSNIYNIDRPVKQKKPMTFPVAIITLVINALYIWLFVTIIQMLG